MLRGEVILYALTVYRLSCHEAWKARPNARRLHLAFITLQLVLVTIGLQGIFTSTVLSYPWLNDSGHWRVRYYGMPIAESTMISYGIGMWFQEAFLIYRLFMVWSGVRRNIILVALAILTWLLSVSSSILLMISEFSDPLHLEFASNTPYGLFFFTSSIGLNIGLTALISLRILFLRRKMHRSLGDVYLSVVSILVESAALYSVVAIGFAVAYGLNSGTGVAILTGVYGIMTAFAPTLIIYKISGGTAWTRQTIDMLTTIHSLQLPPSQEEE